jgi:hypothetical protein
MNALDLHLFVAETGGSGSAVAHERVRARGEWVADPNHSVYIRADHFTDLVRVWAVALTSDLLLSVQCSDVCCALLQHRLRSAFWCGVCCTEWLRACAGHTPNT